MDSSYMHTVKKYFLIENTHLINGLSYQINVYTSSDLKMDTESFLRRFFVLTYEKGCEKIK